MLSDSKPICFLAATDQTKAKEFYRGILGLHLVHEDQFALVFDVRGIMMRIQLVEHFASRPFTATGWEVRDIRDKIRELTKRGVRFLRYEGLNQDDDAVWTSPAGAKIAWFNDPDGNILSLTQFS